VDTNAYTVRFVKYIQCSKLILEAYRVSYLHSIPEYLIIIGRYTVINKQSNRIYNLRPNKSSRTTYLRTREVELSL
jgi:hypothetical protein